MYRIMKFEDDNVIIRADDSRVLKYGKDCLNYKDPQVDDIVEIYGEEGCYVILKSRLSFKAENAR